MKIYVVVVLAALVTLLCIVTALVLIRIYRSRQRNARIDPVRRRSKLKRKLTLPASYKALSKKRAAPANPPVVKAMRRGKEERFERIKQREKEKRKQVVSMWLPKRKGTLPTVKTSLVQPLPLEEEETIKGKYRGRLTFCLQYQYRYETGESILIVKLMSAQDLRPKDSDAIDAFVKTELVPSRKQVYISKVQRNTLNPVFDEKYEFDILFEDLQSHKVHFQVMDFDCFSRHKSVGEVTLPLEELGSHGLNILREVCLAMNIHKPLHK